MSQGPRHINTDRSLNRPTEQRPTEASALHQVSLSGQPDFFQNEQPAPQRPEPPRQSTGGGRGGNGGSSEWEILRVGADFRLKCTGCGHQIMIARKLVEKNTKEIRKKA